MRRPYNAHDDFVKFVQFVARSSFPRADFMDPRLRGGDGPGEGEAL